MEAAPKSASQTNGATMPDPIADVVGRADYETFAQALADDVVFRSPVSDGFRFQGPEITGALFERLVKQSDADRWRVDGSWRLGDGRHIVALTTTIHGQTLELLLLTRLNDRFQICEVTGYGRPMASIALFPAFVYPHLVERFRGRARSKLVRLLFRPLPRLLGFFVKAGLSFGKPPQAAFESKLPRTNLPTPEQSSEKAEQSPPAPAGPRSPFRRI
jgi:hypothetical protein